MARVVAPPASPPMRWMYAFGSTLRSCAGAKPRPPRRAETSAMITSASCCSIQIRMETTINYAPSPPPLTSSSNRSALTKSVKYVTSVAHSCTKLTKSARVIGIPLIVNAMSVRSK